jgi:hypothetical protein
MVDCSKDAIWSMSAAQLLAAIEKAVETAYDDEEEYYAAARSYPAEVSISAACDALISTLKKAKSPVIIFFDEVDYITPSSPTAPEKWLTEFNPFWRNLRAVYQEITRTSSCLSVLVSGVSSKWFRVESINGVENAALTFIPEEYLSPLPSGSAIAMIQDIGEVAGLRFGSDIAKQIADSCGNFPFWIRKACSFIHRNIEINARPCEVDSSAASSLLDTFILGYSPAVVKFAISVANGGWRLGRSAIRRLRAHSPYPSPLGWRVAYLRFPARGGATVTWAGPGSAASRAPGRAGSSPAPHAPTAGLVPPR